MPGTALGLRASEGLLREFGYGLGHISIVSLTDPRRSLKSAVCVPSCPFLYVLVSAWSCRVHSCCMLPEAGSFLITAPIVHSMGSVLSTSGKRSVSLGGLIAAETRHVCVSVAHVARNYGVPPAHSFCVLQPTSCLLARFCPYFLCSHPTAACKLAQVVEPVLPCDLVGVFLSSCGADGTAVFHQLSRPCLVGLF